VPLIRLAILAGFTAILVLGGIQAIEGRIEVGVYSVMVFIVQRLLWPLTRLGETFDLYQRAMASTRRILDLLEEPIALTDGTCRCPHRAARSASRASGSATAPATRCSAASTCTCRPATPTRSSARPAPASRRS
jgi:ABC-type multidrug transport system fused ATPase/permease subunit